MLLAQGDLIDYPYLIDAEPTPAAYLLLCTEDYLRVYSTGAAGGVPGCKLVSVGCRFGATCKNRLGNHNPHYGSSCPAPGKHWYGCMTPSPPHWDRII